MSWFKSPLRDTDASLQAMLDSYRRAFREQLVQEFKDVAETEANRICDELNERMKLVMLDPHRYALQIDYTNFIKEVAK